MIIFRFSKIILFIIWKIIKGWYDGILKINFKVFKMRDIGDLY